MKDEFLTVRINQTFTKPGGRTFYQTLLTAMCTSPTHEAATSDKEQIGIMRRQMRQSVEHATVHGGYSCHQTSPD
jgi:hypothetical protein